MSGRGGAGLAVAGACVLVGLASCPALLEEPRVGLKPGQTVEQTTLDAMNPLLLDGHVTRRIVVEVDWVEGCEPSPNALGDMEAALREAAPPSISVEVVRDAAFPRLRAEQLGGPAEIARYAMIHLPRPALGVAGLYVLFVPGPPRDVTDRLGERVVWRVENEGVAVSVDGILVYADEIRRERLPRITADELEAMVLVHEVGHVLGLVHDPDHEAAGAEGHCANPLCVMAYPRWRTLLLNAPRALLLGRLPSRYCGECRADIDRARDLFARGR